jgi:hypothetical protein
MAENGPMTDGALAVGGGGDAGADEDQVGRKTTSMRGCNAACRFCCSSFSAA